MPRTHATVMTANPSINLKKLCRHFSHKLEASFDDRQGAIHFPFGRADLEAEDGYLTLTGQASTDEQLDRLEQVLGDHLVRFASKESLQVTWQRNA